MPPVRGDAGMHQYDYVDKGGNMARKAVPSRYVPLFTSVFVTFMLTRTTRLS